MSVSGLSSRRRRVVIIAAIGVVVIVVVAAIVVFVNSGSDANGSNASGSDGGDNQKLTAQDIATEFLNALGEGSGSQAGPETTDPTSASGVITAAFDNLKPHGVSATDLKVTTKNTTATVSYTLNWNFGQNHIWNDPAGFTMSQDKNGNWLINWSSSALTPKLRNDQELKLSNSGGVQTATVLSRDGTPLPTQTKGFASAIMPAIRGFAGGQTTQSPSSLTVYIQNPDGSAGDTLYTTAPSGSATSGQAPTVNTSLDIKLQEAAETALGTVPQQAMAVIIQPSTGKILAVANNSAASGLNPLTGLYPPGSTFKIVTAATALSQGKITPQTQVAVPRHDQHRGQDHLQRRQVRPRHHLGHQRLRPVLQHHVLPTRHPARTGRPAHHGEAVRHRRRLHRPRHHHQHRPHPQPTPTPSPAARTASARARTRSACSVWPWPPPPPNAAAPRCPRSSRGRPPSPTPRRSRSVRRPSRR